MTFQQPPPNPNLPQPGWYPDPYGQHVLRWWDGTAWGSQTEQWSDVPADGPAGQPRSARDRGRKSWPRRHKILTAFGAIAAFWIIVIAAIVASRGSSPAASGAAQAPQASPPAASSQPAASSPPTAAAPAARTVATFSGSGIENTPEFTVTSTWKLDYSFDCSAFGSTGNFIVSEDGGSDFGGVSVNELSAGQSGSTWGYNDAGTHYLGINSECSWTVKVIDEP